MDCGHLISALCCLTSTRPLITSNPSSMSVFATAVFWETGVSDGLQYLRETKPFWNRQGSRNSMGLLPVRNNTKRPNISRLGRRWLNRGRKSFQACVLTSRWLLRLSFLGRDKCKTSFPVKPPFLIWLFPLLHCLFLSSQPIIFA